MPPFTLFARRAITPAMLFGTGADLWRSNQSDAGVHVDLDAALTDAGVWAAMRLLAGDISSFPLDAFRGSTELKPEWIENPDPFDPAFTRIDHIAQAAVSLLGDGNCFTIASPDVFNPVVLQVVNPLRVDIKKPGRVPEYRLQDENGRPIGEVLTPLNVIHTRIFTPPGGLRGRNPIEAQAGNIAISIAARKYVENFFGKGAQVPGFVGLPVEATQPQADEVAKKLAQRHGGWRKAGVIGVLGGGAKYERTGITPADADLSSVFRRSLETAAQMYGIPPFLLGSQEASGVSYASSVQRAQDYIDHCLTHYTGPIEAAYRRLVPGGSLKFNYNALLRGDTKSRFEAHGIALTHKFKSIEEIRALEDLPLKVAAGDTLLETPNNNGPRPQGAPQ